MATVADDRDRRPTLPPNGVRQGCRSPTQVAPTLEAEDVPERMYKPIKQRRRRVMPRRKQTNLADDFTGGAAIDFSRSRISSWVQGTRKSYEDPPEA